MKANDINGKHIVVIGSGSNLLTYKNEILSYINNNDVITIGCNNMSHIVIPHFHLFIDRTRFRSFGDKINSKSLPIFTPVFSRGLIRKYWEHDYIVAPFRHYEKEEILFVEDNILQCHFFTSCMASILFSHINHADKITVVGMDGYTFHNRKLLSSGDESQHCYGKGFTDRIHKYRGMGLTEEIFEYFVSVNKDDLIEKTLSEIIKFGAKFKIITPTVYSEYYDGEVLKLIE